MKITKNLIYFGIPFALLTAAFRFFLSSVLASNYIGLLAIIYGVLSFALGLYFGFKDKNDLPIFDVGFRFHCVTFMIYFTISFLWTCSEFGSLPRYLKGFKEWGVFLLIHFVIYIILKSRGIKGLNKEDIFE